MTGAPTIRRTQRPSPEEVAAVLALAAGADDTDGAAPLSEETLLDLRHGADAAAAHLLATDPDGALVGYAHLAPDSAGATAELVVAPHRRRRGVGRALAAGVLAAGGEVRVWAHGDHPAAAALALELRLRRARVLWQLHRLLPAAGAPRDALPEPALPAGLRLRAFRPGADESAWLRVNARAFAEHSEQGRWTARDLTLRMAQPWFDPAGLLLAVREADDELLGFHWTKVHAPADGRGRPIGEVYVVGVDPAARGSGLGRALTLAGLHHLRGRGLDRAMLYVDESNAPALALYTRLGFAPRTAHIQYQFTG